MTFLKLAQGLSRSLISGGRVEVSLTLKACHFH